MRRLSFSETIIVTGVFLALLYEVYRETGWATTVAIFALGVLQVEE
jgi:hypothetical protein